jgi:LPS export ABC transporter permease LptG
VIRRSPTLGIFGRLVAKELLLHAGLTITAGLVLFIAIDTIETGNSLEGRGSVIDLVGLELYNLPLVFQQIAALATMIGATTASAAIARRGESAAIFAAGGPPTALLRPALLVGCVLAGGYASITEWVAPFARAELAATRHRLGLPASGSDSVRRGQSWLKGENRIYRVGALEDQAGLALGQVLMLRIERGRLLDRWDIDRLVYREHAWLAEGCVHRAFGADGSLRTERSSELTLDLAESPDDFVVSVAAPHRLGYRALASTLEAKERLGQPAIEHRVELHRRHAVPLANLLAVVLGVGLALRLGRRPTFAAALGLGAAAGFSGWLLDELGYALAGSGAFPAGIAAHLTLATWTAGACLAWWAAFRLGIRGR